jgi:exosortase/archaeosortase family protein
MKLELNRTSLKIMLCRMAGVGLAVALFYSVSWLPLRRAVRDGVSWVMQHGGFITTVSVYEGSPALLVGSKRFYFTPDCTYVDLWLILIPFLWRLDWPWRRNLGWILGFGVMVCAANFIRLCVSTYLWATGHSWLVAHELPDYVLYYPTLLVVVLIALRRDTALHAARPPPRGASAEAPGTTC